MLLFLNSLIVELSLKFINLTNTYESLALAFEFAVDSVWTFFSLNLSSLMYECYLSLNVGLITSLKSTDLSTATWQLAFDREITRRNSLLLELVQGP